MATAEASVIPKNQGNGYKYPKAARVILALSLEGLAGPAGFHPVRGLVNGVDT